MSRVWGPFTPFGLCVAFVACALDQAHKWWMLESYAIAARQPVRVTPFFDLVLVWNPGVSYGLFPQDSPAGRALLLAIAGLASVALCLWLARASGRLAAFGLGAVIGGAVGNAIDRVVHGAVADFFSLHAFGFNWYVFNLADMAIVAGVAIVLYESLKR
jgi:signal peptidase II